MSEYAERFVENRIDLSVLPDLTDQHLEKLGVALGDRLKILRAIRELFHTTVAAQPGPSAALVVQDSAELRQLTVMFCDLVGSTALSGRLDPEDLRGIIGAYHRCCAETIERNGDFVAKYTGDGVLAYFGYPQAHEHDAERAVRAGLAVVETVPKLDTGAGVPLQVPTFFVANSNFSKCPHDVSVGPLPGRHHACKGTCRLSCARTTSFLESDRREFSYLPKR
jgi:hypothetical protein